MHCSYFCNVGGKVASAYDVLREVTAPATRGSCLQLQTPAGRMGAGLAVTLRCLSLRCRGLELTRAEGQPGQKQKSSCENFQKASLPPRHSHRQCPAPHASPSTHRSSARPSPRVFTRSPPCMRAVCLRLRRQFSTICPCPVFTRRGRVSAGQRLPPFTLSERRHFNARPCKSTRAICRGETEAPRGGGGARIHLYELVLLPPLRFISSMLPCLSPPFCLGLPLFSEPPLAHSCKWLPANGLSEEKTDLNEE